MQRALALPLGELPPKAAERALSVLAVLGHLSQRERQGGCLALPLEELSPQATERALSDLAALGHLSQRERQGGAKLYLLTI